MAKKPNKSGAGAPPPMPNAGNAGVGRPPTAGGGPANPAPRPPRANPAARPPRTGGGAAAGPTQAQAAQAQAQAAQAQAQAAQAQAQAAQAAANAAPATHATPRRRTTTGGTKQTASQRAAAQQAAINAAVQAALAQRPVPTPSPSSGSKVKTYFNNRMGRTGQIIATILLIILVGYIANQIWPGWHTRLPNPITALAGTGANVERTKVREVTKASEPDVPYNVFGSITSSNGVLKAGAMIPAGYHGDNSMNIIGSVITGGTFNFYGNTNVSPAAPKVAPVAPAPVATPVKLWPHDGSQPSATVRTMSECDEMDASKTSDSKTFTLKANSNVAYRTPYGFRVEFYPSDTNRLDKAFNVGSTPAPIWKSTGEYAGSKEPTASVWYFNRGNTDVEIRTESTRTHPPRGR